MSQLTAYGIALVEDNQPYIATEAIYLSSLSQLSTITMSYASEYDRLLVMYAQCKTTSPNTQFIRVWIECIQCLLCSTCLTISAKRIIICTMPLRYAYQHLWLLSVQPPAPSHSTSNAPGQHIELHLHSGRAHADNRKANRHNNHSLYVQTKYIQCQSHICMYILFMQQIRTFRAISSSWQTDRQKHSATTHHHSSVRVMILVISDSCEL